VRIVGGELRGRPLATPRSREIRPSADRLRQALFDILAHGYGDAISGARVLDLFAGTGALGLEALSRGAAFALFVEEGVEGRGLLRRNIEALGLTGKTKVFRRDATQLGPAGTVAPFGLVFADPPYGAGLGEQALGSALSGGWLAPGALCVLEEDARAEVSAIPGLESLETRLVGDSKLIFLRGPGALDRS
jgi:16S rRNA (guanine966-N2)-methyltransferase